MIGAPNLQENTCLKGVLGNFGGKTWDAPICKSNPRPIEHSDSLPSDEINQSKLLCFLALNFTHIRPAHALSNKVRHFQADPLVVVEGAAIAAMHATSFRNLQVLRFRGQDSRMFVCKTNALGQCKNPAFSKPCLCLSDTRLFRHFHRFRRSEERCPCFQCMERKFVIFAVFLKAAPFWQGQTRFTKNTVCATRKCTWAMATCRL